MTNQIPDKFVYCGDPAEAIAISKRFSFSPAKDFGIETMPWGTSNYRGFWCDYSIDEFFIIENLYLTSKNHSYPLINGQTANMIPELIPLYESININLHTPIQYEDGFPMQYLGINYLFEYSGKIVIGIRPSYSKSGRQRYKKVLELQFATGILVEKTDITEIWKSIENDQENESIHYWWQQECCNYYHLVNYSFMGLNEPKKEL